MSAATRPFFAKRTTRAHVRSLALPLPLTIYAGAGVTIDRTGLSWSSLSRTLLSQTFDADSLTYEAEREIGPQRLASIALERLRAIEGDNVDQRVADLLRIALYRNTSWVGGRVIQGVARLVDARRAGGFSTTLITTNYDDFIDTNLPGPFNVTANGAEVSGFGDPDALVSINYVHGRVPRIPNNADLEVVLSERQYAETSERVCDELISAFQQSNVLIIGSSLTDPPLVRALSLTRDEAKKKGFRRRVIIPRQNSDLAASTIGRSLIRDGAAHLGCEAIITDYYCQTAQFVHEVSVCAEDDKEYCRDVSRTRYGPRLDQWWARWMSDCEDRGVQESQGDDHKALEELLGQIRGLLDAPDEERLKLELWVRWRPAEQTLRLWASSVSNWSDLATMRVGPIEQKSPYVSVQAFCAGTPILDETSSTTDRWKTYLSAPIWISNKYGHIHIAGVVTLASMSGSNRSSVAERNRAKVRRALTAMTARGAEMLSRGQ